MEYSTVSRKEKNSRFFPVVDLPKEAFLPPYPRFRALWTGEKRPPRKGEYYLSGNPVEAYRAPDDLTTPFHIAKIHKVGIKTAEVIVILE